MIPTNMQTVTHCIQKHPKPVTNKINMGAKGDAAGTQNSRVPQMHVSVIAYPRIGLVWCSGTEDWKFVEAPSNHTKTKQSSMDL